MHAHMRIDIHKEHMVAKAKTKEQFLVDQRFKSSTFIKNATAKSWRTRFRGRSLVFADKEKSIFIRSYASNGRFGDASIAAGVCNQTVRNHLDSDEEFCAAFEQAKDHYRDRFVEHHQNLCLDGVRTPIIGGKDRDEIIGYSIKYPEGLIAMELKKIDPAYRDKQQLDVNHQGGVLVVAEPETLEEHRQTLEDHRKKTREDMEKFGTLIEGKVVKK